jgi:3-oxoacyl-[acyl-carrier-protein] synthase I
MAVATAAGTPVSAGTTWPTKRPALIRPVAVRAYTATGAHGQGLEALADDLANNRSALRPNDLPDLPLPCAIGRVDGLETLAWPVSWAAWDSRATRLAWLGLQADGFIDTVARARQRHGAARVGLVLGTSASTITVSEAAYRQLDTFGRFPPALRHPEVNTPHAITAFVQQALALEGPSLTVSTACSSSAKALAVAERWLRSELVDAVVCAGVDALGGSLLYGFHSLQVLSSTPCRPFDAGRKGISIGEAAAYALLERGAGDLVLRGYGESNDAHHMSSPHPLGIGAERALDDAAARAGLPMTEVDFVNLHGTATAANDEVEAGVLVRRYGESVHACATKGLSGHTMGAAGLLEAAICLLALERGLLAGSGPTAEADPAMGPHFARRWHAQPVRRRIRSAASHSFGFGGNNCVLVFGC